MRMRSRLRPPSSWWIGVSGRLAEDVPQRDVEGRVAAHLDAAARETEDGVEQHAAVPVDLQRVLAEQIGAALSWM